MKSSSAKRLSLSAIVAFAFYASWAWYANSLVEANTHLLIKAALVQGTYSAIVTFAFSWLIERSYQRFGSKRWCLALIVPHLEGKVSHISSTTNVLTESLESSKRACRGNCLPGIILSPLPAVVVQTSLVVGVNYLFDTPNLLLTVLPSIGFSALYGYAYTLGLHRQLTLASVTNT